MRPPQDDLSAGEWSVLALLAERPSHGFAVARALAPDGPVGQVWSMRRALVYRAIDKLVAAGLARPARTEPGESGPRRTVVEPTSEGTERVEAWLAEPVAHVRDARSLLLLKLLFLDRRGVDTRDLIDAQQRVFERVKDGLEQSAAEATGFERTLAVWRLENAAAALRFVERLSGARSAGEVRGEPGELR